MLNYKLEQRLNIYGQKPLKYLIKKKKEDVPDSIIRTIYRVSALLETVDLEFARLVEQKRNYRESITDLANDELLNVDILEKILDEELPFQNKKESEPYADLIEDLNNFEIETLEDLRNLIQDNYDQIIENEEKRIEELLSEKEKSDIYMASKHRLNEGFFFSHVGLTRQGLESEFGEDWIEYNLEKAEDKILNT